MRAIKSPDPPCLPISKSKGEKILDKAKDAVRTARNLSERLNKRVRCVISPKDPKEYSDSEISRYILL